MPSESTTDGPDLVGALPVFEDPNPEDPTAGPDRPPPPAAATPSQTRTPSSPLRPTVPQLGTSGTGPSPKASSDNPDLKDALGDLAAGVFTIAGVVLNKAEVRRTRQATLRWLPTDDERQAFGEVAERFAMRRLPEELREEGDASDGLVAASVLLGYAMRNVAGVSPADLQGGTVAPPPPPQPAPPPPANPQGPPPAPARVNVPGPDVAASGIAKSEPPPPAIFDPGI